ncbi:MAG: indolepyruvate ferredoxin oxidoreductase [Acidobacteria bacterium]|nr:indolepyruvate ferredoxin oxidoreductase [Acidobacteriota bacterium]
MGREVLLGDEAVGLGAVHAGLTGIFGYPGTPSTEIFEFVERIARKRGDIEAHWSTNEKVAYEEALGVSWAGRRALVTMKHVGLNVAADAFMNSAVTGANGGLVLAVADDPGMHSSQNEQDSRYFAKFALIPCFEPRDQQACYDMTRDAYDLSEELGIPVMVRLVTRIAHSRSAVETVSEPRPQNPLEPAKDIRRWTLLPSNARVQYRILVEKQPELLRRAEESPYNVLELRGKRGIIACGITLNYALENLPRDHDWSILAIGQYPVPPEKLRRLVEHVDEVLVLEDGYPFVEEMLRGLFGLGMATVRGRLTGELPRTGELNPDLVRAGMGLPEVATAAQMDTTAASRPPTLCPGCPHTDTYKALNEALEIFTDPQVFSDIGCYTLGALPPLQAIHSCVDMGASISMAAGAAIAGYRPAVAVIGDSTFAHSGMTGLLSAIEQEANVNIVIVDNETVAMTGTQPSAATMETLDRIVLGLGIDPEHFRVITPVPKNHADNVRVFREELEHEGPSVIVARRACIEKIKRHR